VQVVPGGPAWFHPGRSGTLQFGPKNVVGAFGEVHPKILKALDVKGPLVAFELTLDNLPPPKYRPTKIKPKLQLSEFQPVTRDFAFVVARSVAAGDILKAAQAAERQLIADIDVFDVYEGAGIDPDKKSVAIAVTLQPKEKTLTDAEIEAVSARIVAEVAKKTGAVLRS
jgi:phenylalanyl-tRNA synthetase beta chain